MLNKFIVNILLVIFLITLLMVPVFAHRMLIKPVEPGKLQIIFDNKSPAPMTQVRFLDKDNKEIFTATADNEGYVVYDTNLKIARVIADDGLGHKTQWKYGEEFKMPMSLKTKGAIGVFGLAFVATFFHFKTQRKKATVGS